MRLIYVVPFTFYPAYSGSNARILETVKALGLRHEVDVIIQDDLPRDESVRAHLASLVRSVTYVPRRPGDWPIAARGGERWKALVSTVQVPPSFLHRFRSHAVVERVNALVAEGGVDWLLCETLMSGQVVLSPHLAPVRRAITLHDAFTRTLYRAYAATPPGLYRARYYADWLKGRWYERRIVQRCDVVNVVSVDEQRLIRRYVPTERIRITPNGVDTAYFQPVRRATSEGNDQTILFLGSMDYEPNVDAVAYFVREVWPMVRREVPGARFIAGGSNPPPSIRALAERDAAITVPGTVEDVRPLYAQSSVIVVPLRLGGGTKTKTLEALAMGVPVVATPCGAEGLALQHGQHILVGQTSGELAAHLVTVLNDPARASALAAAGRSVVEARYSWAACLARLEDGLHLDSASGI